MVRIWDTRSPQPACEFNAGMKVFSTSVSANLLVCAAANHQVMVCNLQETLNTGQINPVMAIPSPLKYQTRHVEAFPHGDGYAITSIEGRCGVKNIDFNNLQDKHKDDFNFRAH